MRRKKNNTTSTIADSSNNDNGNNTSTAAILAQLSALHPVPAQLQQRQLRFDPTAWAAAREALLLQLLDEFEDERERLLKEILSRPDYHYTPEGLTRLLNFRRALDDIIVNPPFGGAGCNIDPRTQASAAARIEKRKKYPGSGSGNNGR